MVPFLCYCGCNMTAHCWPRGEGMSSAWIRVVVSHKPVCQYNCTVRNSDVDVILCIVCTNHAFRYFSAITQYISSFSVLMCTLYEVRKPDVAKQSIESAVWFRLNTISSFSLTGIFGYLPLRRNLLQMKIIKSRYRSQLPVQNLECIHLCLGNFDASFRKLSLGMQCSASASP
jgi:hypothetical protein